MGLIFTEFELYDRTIWGARDVGNPESVYQLGTKDSIIRPIIHRVPYIVLSTPRWK